MKILALPNAFKGSLSAASAALLLQKNLSPRHRVAAFPVSDGGDGFIDFFKTLYPSAKLRHLTARNAFNRPAKTAYLILPDGKTAILETARICGLGSAKPQDLDPLNATSYGVGEVLLHAVKHGAKTIYVGLGGVACNDGGAGAAAACGAQLLDKQGAPIALGAQALLKLAQVRVSALKQHFRGIKIYAVADVTNPLLGPRSSAKVFGPQKGASPEQVKILDKALGVYARVLKKTTGKEIAHTPSTAAAGAICAGLYGCFNARILLGAEYLFKKAGFEKYARTADLIITAEGKLDRQTFGGKAPLAVLKLAKKYQKPVLFICGVLDETCLRHNPLAPQQIAVLADFAPTPEQSRAHAAKYLAQLCKSL